MESQEMPFLAFIRGNASCWSGDANFRFQNSRFEKKFSLHYIELNNCFYLIEGNSKSNIKNRDLKFASPF